MADPKEMHDTDGVENPRITGDSADQIYDDDTMDNNDDGSSSQERTGGTGGLNGGLTQVTGCE